MRAPSLDGPCTPGISEHELLGEGFKVNETREQFSDFDWMLSEPHTTQVQFVLER